MMRITCCLLLAVLCSATGCTAFNKDWKQSLPWSPQSRLKNSKFETPSHLIAIWTPDVLTPPGKQPTRGFGGRIYFYNEKNQAVPVEGQLVVYAYDDHYNADQPGEPQRKFAFTPEQFTKHYSESDLGASYSIWLPWDPVGGIQQNISLVPVFTATSGKVVMGQQALNVLPGAVAQKPKTDGPTSLLSVQPASGFPTNGAESSVQQVSHQQPPQRDEAGLPSSGAARTRMRTSTITLTPSLSRRVAMAAEVPPPAPAIQAIPVPGAGLQPGNGTAPIGQPIGGFPTTTSTEASRFPPPAAAPVPSGSDPPPAHFGQMKFPAREALTERSNPPAPWTPPYPSAPRSALQSAW